MHIREMIVRSNLGWFSVQHFINEAPVLFTDESRLKLSTCDRQIFIGQNMNCSSIINVNINIYVSSYSTVIIMYLPVA